jgi:homoserine dehydrogenase
MVDGELIASVGPAFVHRDAPLAKVDGVLNAVQIEGDLIGRVLFEGPGAGPMPTASAVLADVLDAARDIVAGRRAPATIPLRPVVVRAPEQVEARYYMRITVADQAGVLARLAGALGDNDISIASVIQFETDQDARTAELVITTHPAAGGAMSSALATIEALEVVVEVGNVLPMVGP